MRHDGRRTIDRRQTTVHKGGPTKVVAGVLRAMTGAVAIGTSLEVQPLKLVGTTWSSDCQLTLRAYAP